MSGLIINIRGANGSGKSTLAREFLPPNLRGDHAGGPVDLAWYDAPTKREPNRRLRTMGYTNARTDTIVVGRYDTACGGMDAMPGFAACQASIRSAMDILDEREPTGQQPVTVVAEGVLASTVFGSWAEFDREVAGRGWAFAWCYLATPLDVCLARIKARQAASGKERPIKEDLVADKVKAVRATRLKARDAGRLVYDLPLGEEREAILAIAGRQGDRYRV